MIITVNNNNNNIHIFDFLNSKLKSFFIFQTNANQMSDNIVFDIFNDSIQSYLMHCRNALSDDSRIHFDNMYTNEITSTNQFIISYIANYIHKKIIKYNLRIGLTYTGISIHESYLQICNIGDIRTHLLNPEQEIKVTRDHNLIDDRPENVNTEFNIDDIDIFVLKNTLTRVLGYGDSILPETYCWKIENKSNIYICDARIHSYSKSYDYINSENINGLTVHITNDIEK